MIGNYVIQKFSKRETIASQRQQQALRNRCRCWQSNYSCRRVTLKHLSQATHKTCLPWNSEMCHNLSQPFLTCCFGRHDFFSHVATTFSCGLFWSSRPFLTGCHDLFLRVVLVVTGITRCLLVLAAKTTQTFCPSKKFGCSLGPWYITALGRCCQC